MTKETGKHAAFGALAGLAGTALIQGMTAGSRRFAPETLPPMTRHPGEFMVEQAEKVFPHHIRRKIPAKAEAAAAISLAFGYGATFGALYALAPSRARGDSTAEVFTEGAALGAAAWAVGYLGWLPATKLTPPVWKHRAKQVVPGILSHVLFGVVTVGALRWLAKKF